MLRLFAAYSATIKPSMSELGNDPTLFKRVHIDLVYALCMSEHTVSITDNHQSVIDEMVILLNDL
jgi:hypothetical protein